MESNAKLTLVSPVAAAGNSGGGLDDSHVAQDAERTARYRLVIEEGPQKGVFIYKTMDRITGEVIRQLPREEVVRMMDQARYRSGSVIDTQA